MAKKKRQYLDINMVQYQGYTACYWFDREKKYFRAQWNIILFFKDGGLVIKCFVSEVYFYSVKRVYQLKLLYIMVKKKKEIKLKDIESLKEQTCPS